MIDRRRDSSVGVIFVVLTLLSMMNAIFGAGRFEVSVFSLTNKCGRLANGNVCTDSLIKTNDSALCPGVCNVVAEVCLQPPNSKERINDYSWCPYGNGSSSGVVSQFNSFDLDSRNNAGFIFIPFTFSWPGAVTLILVLKHRDYSTGKEYLIAKSVKFVNANASRTSNWTTLIESSKIANVADDEVKIVFGYKIQCDPTDYGSQCSKSCMSRDDETGHYKCDDDGNRRCLDGWKGNGNCLEPICSPDCKGACHKPGTCDKCPFGWNGTHCDQCIRYVGCVHGYCNKPFECICEPRWGGLQCDIDMDYCFHKSPCRNGARCIPHAPNNYTCLCEPGFAGKDCEIELNPCWANPCLNFGTCVLTSKNNYQCLCDQLHSGARCEILLEGKSATDPCFYDGMVFDHGSRWDTSDCRKCQCMDGFSNCSEAKCNAADCLFSSNSAHCPAGQTCRSVSPDFWTCLKWPCSQEKFGQCIPLNLIENSGSSNRDKCEMKQTTTSTVIRKRVEDDLEFCSRFFVKLRQDLIPSGTYPEHICFQLLLLLMKQQMTTYNVFCSLDRPNLTLTVDVVSASDRGTVNGVKPYLIEVLKSTLPASNPLLRPIVSVYDEQSTTTLVNNQVGDSPPTASSINFHWLIIYVLPSVIFIVVILLLVIVLILKRRRVVESKASSTTPTTKAGMNDCEMQWNNLGASCASIFSNSLMCNNGKSKIIKQCNLYNEKCDRKPDVKLTSPTGQKSNVDFDNRYNEKMLSTLNDGNLNSTIDTCHVVKEATV